MPQIGPWFEGLTCKEAIERAERYCAEHAHPDAYNIGVGRELERLVGHKLDDLLGEVVGLVRDRDSGACLRCTYRRGLPDSFPFYALRRPGTMVLEVGTRADFEGSGLKAVVDYFDRRSPA